MAPHTTSTDRIPSADPKVRTFLLFCKTRVRLTRGCACFVEQVASSASYEIAIIGAGILGSVLAYSLAESGRSVLLVERDLSEPDRIVGELLQPGGCIALKKLGIDDTLQGIDAVPCEGYKVFWGEQEVAIPYPQEDIGMGWSEGGVGADDRKQEGRSFHHGRFIQNLRKKAASAKGVTLVEATVNDLIRDDLSGAVLGLTATPKSSNSDPSPLTYRAHLTIIVDGCMSKFRRQLLPTHLSPLVRSHFVGLVLEDADLPAPHHGHVILGKTDPSAPTPTTPNTIGPVLVYQLATHETRMLIDVRGSKAPSTAQLAPYLRENVTKVLPPSIVPSFHQALDKSTSGDKSYRLRSMPNSFLPPYPQGRDVQGAFLAGDSLNMRHPLTGGGMTVAFNDAVLLTGMLGGDKQVGELKADSRGPVDLQSWLDVSERLEEWHWERKAVASCINVLAMALYSLFGADGQSRSLIQSAAFADPFTPTDENLEVLKTGCFKYFELGGECIAGPVSLLSA